MFALKGAIKFCNRHHQIPRLIACYLVVFGLSLSGTAAWADWDVRGNFTQELSVFPHTAIHEANQSSNYSLSAEAEFYSNLGDNGSITITPFLRVDRNDSERTHVDFREFIYTHVGDTWEARAGLGKVFFGVAESENLVDVINQTDAVESFTTDQKLGQPMINLTLIKDWGNIDLFVLPGFRTRTFAGANGRPRLPFVVNTDAAEFEASNGNDQIDFAARVSGVIGDWDLGAQVFHGTAREPLIQFNPSVNALTPLYIQNTEIGFDAQATLESWLLKAEIVHRAGKLLDDHIALVAGFEYSFFDIKSSGADLGIVAEYLYDERGDGSPSLLQNDALIAFRLALNNAASTEALAGVITDLDGAGNLLSLEASRRFGDSFKASISYTGFSVNDSESPLINLDREDNTRIELGYFF